MTTTISGGKVRIDYGSATAQEWATAYAERPSEGLAFAFEWITGNDPEAKGEGAWAHVSTEDVRDKLFEVKRVNGQVQYRDMGSDEVQAAARAFHEAAAGISTAGWKAVDDA